MCHHHPRIPDRIVFDKLIQVLVFGCDYRRIADTSYSATTLRRRRDELTATRGPGIPATSVAGQRLGLSFPREAYCRLHEIGQSPGGPTRW
jgi:hypothetical protein